MACRTSQGQQFTYGNSHPEAKEEVLDPKFLENHRVPRCPWASLGSISFSSVASLSFATGLRSLLSPHEACQDLFNDLIS